MDTQNYCPCGGECYLFISRGEAVKRCKDCHETFHRYGDDWKTQTDIENEQKQAIDRLTKEFSDFRKEAFNKSNLEKTKELLMTIREKQNEIVEAVFSIIDKTSDNATKESLYGIIKLNNDCRRMTYAIENNDSR